MAEGGEATQRATQRVFLCEAKMNDTDAVSPLLHQTDRREDG